MKGFPLLILWAQGACAFAPTLSSSSVIREQVGHSSTLYSIPNSLDTAASGILSILRLPKGVTVDQHAKDIGDEIRLLQLFDVENNRECRKVRERITELDLVVEKIIPAAANSRSMTGENGEFKIPSKPPPVLVVQESGSGSTKTLSGAEAILEYLDNNFLVSSATNTEENNQLMEVIESITSNIAGFTRPGRGMEVSPAALGKNVPRPKEPLILYSYDGNQFCRLVREVLLELDIVYELRSAGKQSPRREELASITGGSSQCPYLIDPNTGVSMPESADIVEYLYKTYAKYTPPNELLLFLSDNFMPLLKPIFQLLAPLQAGSKTEDTYKYKEDLEVAQAEVVVETMSSPVVIYTYKLSPFCTEAISLLDRLGIEYNEISLGLEWVPGLITPEGALKRAALLDLTGQSSLPHIFVGGESIGGLTSGKPGLVPALNSDKFLDMVAEGKKSIEAIKKGGKRATFPIDDTIGAFE
jgi:glutaredoxin